MSTDRELLELAAVAAGIGPVIGYAAEAGELMIGPRKFIRYWSPINDAATAFLLSVRLRQSIQHWPDEDGKGPYVSVDDDYIEHFADHQDPLAATCRAITRAAAAIGEQMQNELSREA